MILHFLSAEDLEAYLHCALDLRNGYGDCERRENGIFVKIGAEYNVFALFCVALLTQSVMGVGGHENRRLGVPILDNTLLL